MKLFSLYPLSTVSHFILLKKTKETSLQVGKGVGPSAVVRAQGGFAGRGGGEGGLQGVERADRHGEGQDAHRRGGKGLFTLVC